MKGLTRWDARRSQTRENQYRRGAQYKNATHHFPHVKSYHREISLLQTFHGNTRNGTLLVSVPLGVTTVTKPVVAPGGTVALIKVSDMTLNCA
jgi:hypothetical protein